MPAPISFRTDPAAALGAYREQGCFIEPPGLWPEAQIDQLVRAAAELPSARDRTFAPCMHPHRVDETFLLALRNPNIVAVMEKLLGGAVSGIQTEMFFCAPGTHGFARHQDNHYVEAAQDAFASAWTALEDVTVQSGALILWPGTHREPILPTEPLPTRAGGAGQDPNANKQQAVVPPQFKAVDVPVPRGAVVFLHGHTVHASNDNRSDHFRRALLMTYVRRGEKFRPGNFAKRAEVDVYARP